MRIYSPIIKLRMSFVRWGALFISLDKRGIKSTVALMILLLTMINTSLKAQEAFEPATEDISKKLPPLSVLIDSAVAHDPYVRFRNLQLIVNKSKLRADKSQWARNMGVQTDIRHGTFDNFSTNTSEGQNPSLFATRSNQTNYGVGAYIKFPIYDLLNRRNQIRLAETELEQAASMAEMQRNEVRQLVIKQYNDLILKHRLLKIRLKFVETARINMQMADKEFQNGVVDITEYSRISEISARSESDFEIARIDFITAYLILEEIVGFSLNLAVIQ